MELSTTWLELGLFELELLFSQVELLESKMAILHSTLCHFGARTSSLRTPVQILICVATHLRAWVPRQRKTESTGSRHVFVNQTPACQVPKVGVSLTRGQEAHICRVRYFRRAKRQQVGVFQLVTKGIVARPRHLSEPPRHVEG